MTNSQIGGKRKRKKGKGRKQNPNSNLSSAASYFGYIAVIRLLVIYGILILCLIAGLIYGNVHHHGWVIINADLISESDCHEEYNNKGNASGRKCNYDVSFIVNDSKINGSLNNVTKQTLLNGGKQIEIEYNPKNPSHIGTPFTDTRHILNVVLPIVISVVSVLFYLFYKNRKNKVVKGIAGVSWALNIIRR